VGGLSQAARARRVLQTGGSRSRKNHESCPPRQQVRVAWQAGRQARAANAAREFSCRPPAEVGESAPVRPASQTHRKCARRGCTRQTRNRLLQPELERTGGGHAQEYFRPFPPCARNRPPQRLPEMSTNESTGPRGFSPPLPLSAACLTEAGSAARAEIQCRPLPDTAAASRFKRKTVIHTRTPGGLAMPASPKSPRPAETFLEYAMARCLRRPPATSGR